MKARQKVLWHYGCLWLLFFLICFGFGYPSLTRYDARTNNSDVIHYYQMIVNSPQEAAGRWRYRVLVPYVAKPFYQLAKGRVGSWEPVYFGLLVANSLFCATTACLLSAVGNRVLAQPAIALLAATLYLMNFAIPNFQLAGLVDSAEACSIMILTWACFAKRWFWLPITGVMGALAKETFIPLALVFTLT